MIGLGTIINTTAIVLGGISGHLCFLFNVSLLRHKSEVVGMNAGT